MSTIHPGATGYRQAAGPSGQTFTLQKFSSLRLRGSCYIFIYTKPAHPPQVALHIHSYVFFPTLGSKALFSKTSNKSYLLDRHCVHFTNIVEYTSHTSAVWFVLWSPFHRDRNESQAICLGSQSEQEAKPGRTEIWAQICPTPKPQALKCDIKLACGFDPHGNSVRQADINFIFTNENMGTKKG